MTRDVSLVFVVKELGLARVQAETLKDQGLPSGGNIVAVEDVVEPP
jgi:hypothetical protein